MDLKYTLKDILRLDSIYGLLPFHERIIVRGKLLEWHWAVLPNSVMNLVTYLSQVDVPMPDLRFGQDRLVYVVHDGFVQPLEEYRAQNKDIETILKEVIKR